MQVLSNAIREHIKDLMQQQKLTVSELARRSSVTQSTLDSILHTKNTKPRIDTIHKMIKALNISVPEFFKPLSSTKKHA